MTHEIVTPLGVLTPRLGTNALNDTQNSAQGKVAQSCNLHKCWKSTKFTCIFCIINFASAGYQEVHRNMEDHHSLITGNPSVLSLSFSFWDHQRYIPYILTDFCCLESWKLVYCKTLEWRQTRQVPRTKPYITESHKTPTFGNFVCFGASSFSWMGNQDFQGLMILQAWSQMSCLCWIMIRTWEIMRTGYKVDFEDRKLPGSDYKFNYYCLSKYYQYYLSKLSVQGSRQQFSHPYPIMPKIISGTSCGPSRYSTIKLFPFCSFPCRDFIANNDHNSNTLPDRNWGSLF